MPIRIGVQPCAFRVLIWREGDVSEGLEAITPYPGTAICFESLCGLDKGAALVNVVRQDENSYRSTTFENLDLSVATLASDPVNKKYVAVMSGFEDGIEQFGISVSITPTRVFVKVSDFTGAYYHDGKWLGLRTFLGDSSTKLS